MAETERPQAQKRRISWPTVLATIVVAALILAIACPIMVTTNGHRMPTTWCRHNLQQCHWALMAYVNEHGGVFPKFASETEWVPCALLYLVEDESARFRVLHCPQTVYQLEESRGCLRSRRAPVVPVTDYAFNMALCGRKVAEVSPDEPLLREPRSYGHRGSPMGTTVGGAPLRSEQSGEGTR